jgi:hypothetical protein
VFLLIWLKLIFSEGYRACNERKAQKAFPVGTRGHPKYSNATELGFKTICRVGSDNQPAVFRQKNMLPNRFVFCSYLFA